MSRHAAVRALQAEHVPWLCSGLAVRVAIVWHGTEGTAGTRRVLTGLRPRLTAEEYSYREGAIDADARVVLSAGVTASAPVTVMRSGPQAWHSYHVRPVSGWPAEGLDVVIAASVERAFRADTDGVSSVQQTLQILAGALTLVVAFQPETVPGGLRARAWFGHDRQPVDGASVPWGDVCSAVQWDVHSRGATLVLAEPLAGYTYAIEWQHGVAG